MMSRSVTITSDGKMALPNSRVLTRRPTHPGEMLRAAGPAPRLKGDVGRIKPLRDTLSNATITHITTRTPPP